MSVGTCTDDVIFCIPTLHTSRRHQAVFAILTLHYLHNVRQLDRYDQMLRAPANPQIYFLLSRHTNQLSTMPTFTPRLITNTVMNKTDGYDTRYLHDSVPQIYSPQFSRLSIAGVSFS